MVSSYHHHVITRLKAEDLLTNAAEDGSFLVRDSETVPGAYVLCLLCKGLVHQYRILPTLDGRLAVQCEGGVDGPKFSDLDQLIQQYLERGDQNGLVCALKFPISSEEKTEDNERDSEEEDMDVGASSHNWQPSEPVKPVSAVASTRAEISHLERSVDVVHNTETAQTTFANLDMSCFEGEFVEALKLYVDIGMNKDGNLQKTGGADVPLSHLQETISPASLALNKQLDLFLEKVSVFLRLFGVTEGNKDSGLANLSGKSFSLSSLSEKLSHCAEKIHDLQQKAEAYFTELNAKEVLESQLHANLLTDLPPPPPAPLLREQQMSNGSTSSGSLDIPITDFEVKQLKHHRVASIVRLSIDIKIGKLFAVKTSSKEVLDDSNVFTHDKILQLIKSTKDNSRLDIIISGKKFTYQFVNVHTRESFCQLIQHMKSVHSTAPEVDQISVFVGSWNMGNVPPPWNMKFWLLGEGKGKTRDTVFEVISHDLYVIGTQESALTEKDWANSVQSTLHECFGMHLHIVDVCTLWGIRIVVLVKPEHVHRISHVQHASVRTGLANKLGNKGAAAVSMHFNGTSFCFINSHLASGHERNNRRNQNYRDIVKGLSLGEKNLGLFDVTNQFHHVFWLGDLNYRIQGDVHHTLMEARQGKISTLLERDQLLISHVKKEAFINFCEEAINFMPTYRLKRGIESLDYDWRKMKKTGERINAPSWCDRILWKSYPGTYVENTSYGCCYKVVTSDHRPVFAMFNVGIASQFVSSGLRSSVSENTSVEIVFDTVSAEVKTCCNQYFYLEMFSACFKEPITSHPNKSFNSSDNNCRPFWPNNLLPSQVFPLFAERDYLEDQHILIAVRARDGDNESYGECVVSLKNMFSIEPQPFDCILAHQAEETGKLWGRFHVVNHNAQRSMRRSIRKTYEIVTLDIEYDDSDAFIPETPPEVSPQRHMPPSNFNDASSFRGRANGTASPDEASLSGHIAGGVIASSINHSHSAVSQSVSQTGSDKKVNNVPLNLNMDYDPTEVLGAAGEYPPRPRPRMHMGQSSLNQTQVLPITSPTSPARPLSTTEQGLVQLPTRGVDTIATGSVMVTGATAMTTAGATSTVMSLVPIDRVAAAITVTPGTTVITTTTGTPGNSKRGPPPIPKRQKSGDSVNQVTTAAAYLNERRYAGLKRPATVDDWLVGLGLTEYIPLFLSNGWDTMDFLGDLCDTDLNAMFIRDEKHRERIMESLKFLRIKK